MLTGQKEKLEAQKKQYYDNIKYNEALLKKYKKKRDHSLDNLKLIQRNIASRKSIIKLQQEEVQLIQEKIQENQELIEYLNRDIQDIKTEYEKLIKYAFKSKKTINNYFIFLLSSNSFNQMYKRLMFISSYAKHRKRQRELIEDIEDVMVNRNRRLKENFAYKNELISGVLKETQKMNVQIDEERSTYAQLKAKENKLRKDIKADRKRAKRLEKEIAEIIRKEIERQKNSAVLREEDKVISARFLKSMGKHSWPLDKGVVISKFGKRPHPILSGVVLENFGIEISTEEKANVYSIFDGEVTKTYAILGANTTVIVKHGQYYSVYQNLVDINVKKGQLIAKGSVIGKVFTDESTSSSKLNFQIWNGKTRVNPEKWLKKR